MFDSLAFANGGEELVILGFFLAALIAAFLWILTLWRRASEIAAAEKLTDKQEQERVKEDLQRAQDEIEGMRKTGEAPKEASAEQLAQAEEIPQE